MAREKETSARPRNFSNSFENALAKLKKSTAMAIRTGAMVSVLSAPIAGFAGCVDGDGNPTEEDPLLLPGAADGWLDDHGTRDTYRVGYINDYWHEYTGCNSRGGCSGVAVFLKVRITPVAGENLDHKRVGVVYSNPGGGDVHTALGGYFTTYDNGDEEWHIRIDRNYYETSVLRINAWYQDGLGSTYFDDNNGEGHVAAYGGRHSVIYNYVPYGEEPVSVGPTGVNGRIYLMVADLDYDKDIRMVWTIDNWANANEAQIGSPSEANSLYWIEDTWSGYERWAIDLDIPGDVSTFEYAFVYRHGAVNDAQLYEFWDNNGGHNYVINAE